MIKTIHNQIFPSRTLRKTALQSLQRFESDCEQNGNSLPLYLLLDLIQHVSDQTNHKLNHVSIPSLHRKHRRHSEKSAPLQTIQAIYPGAHCIDQSEYELQSQVSSVTDY